MDFMTSQSDGGIEMKWRGPRNRLGCVEENEDEETPTG
jgi:hypothetical protein